MSVAVKQYFCHHVLWANFHIQICWKKVKNDFMKCMLNCIFWEWVKSRMWHPDVDLTCSEWIMKNLLILHERMKWIHLLKIWRHVYILWPSIEDLYIVCFKWMNVHMQNGRQWYFQNRWHGLMIGFSHFPCIIICYYPPPPPFSPVTIY